MKNLPFVSVIVPAFNEEAHIESCLTSLREQDYDPELFEIILIDNGSTDSTAKKAQDLADIVRVFPGINVGAVRNKGASLANGEYLAFIDADCTAPVDWLKNGVEVLSKGNLVAAGGGCDLAGNAAWIERLWLLENPKNKNTPKDFIGCSIITKKSAFIGVNGFNEEVTSGEDTQLGQDFQKKHLPITISSKLNVVHLGNATTPVSFVKRQVWHSENYIKDIKNSAKDPTFILVTVFFLLILSSIFTLIISGKLATVLVFMTLSIPAIFSFKRIIRSKNPKYLRPSNLIGIYFLDLLYLAGRTLGLAKGLYKVFDPTGR